jgi:hypothetical protein
MTLVSVDRPGIQTANGVHFPMRDGQQRSVRVHVTLEALWGKEVAPVGGDALKRFEGTRRLFEFMAAGKYDSGRPIPKITITAEDVVVAAQRMQRKFGFAQGTSVPDQPAAAAPFDQSSASVVRDN